MPTLHHDDGRATVWHGDCLDVLRELPDCSVDAIVTDPPYGLSDLRPAQVTAAITAWAAGDRERVPDARGFMGRSWDAFVPPPAVWDECMRVLKPGGHMLVFAGSRTVDLMGLSIRLAGFEIRDTLQWLYGSGFPKSMNVAKAIESGSGRPEDIRRMSMGDQYVPSGRGRSFRRGRGAVSEFAPVTDAAREWSGWGTALKPAAEPIILARKPLESTVARNVLAHGVGGLNIDGCRVGMSDADRDRLTKWHAKYGGFEYVESGTALGKGFGAIQPPAAGGRFPANVILSHSETCTDDACGEGCPVAELDAQSGVSTSKRADRGAGKGETQTFGVYGDNAERVRGHEDSGGASRFFPSFRYQAKAPKSERPKVDGVAHPTCKPLAVMAWLARLLCPPGGTVLEPFAGSGTTVEACLDEGFRVIGVEREADYLPLIDVRVQRATQRATARTAGAGPDGLFDLDTAA